MTSRIVLVVVIVMLHLAAAPAAAIGRTSAAAQTAVRPAVAPSDAKPTDAKPTDAAAGEGRSPEALLAELRSLYEALEYDRVIPLADALLAHPDATVEQRLDAYLLHGSALAVVGNHVEAEMPFRFLLRGRPDFDLPADTPPKIMAVFRKVQLEERAIRDQLAAHVRRDLVRTMRIEGAQLTGLVGGFPARLDLSVTDPRGAVRSVRVDYRRAGRAEFSSLPLERQASGRWTGEIPGQWTENQGGFQLEYRVTTIDAANAPLLSLGADAPLVATVAEGTVAGATPFYQSWWFWSASAVAAAAVVGAAGAVGWVLTQPPAGDLGVVAID